MKTMRKTLALLIVVVMIAAMLPGALAATATPTTYTITINNSATGHTYEAYQIFTGDLGTGDTLSNIVWGSGISEAGKTALGDAAAKAETLKNEADAKAFAKAVAPYLSNVTGSANSVTDGKYEISSLAAGYYLVKDQEDTLTGDNDSYTEYILRVVNDTSVNPKSSLPTVQKKVKDINNSTSSEMTDWQDSADHDIGDSVPFQLKATLANNVSSYTTYKVVFHDTLSKGLTYNNDAKVYIDNAEKTGFTVNPAVNADGTTTLTVSCNDVKALGATNSSVITVEYTAKLNENAVIGSDGNPNEVYLEYSNNPNKSESGNNETGKTPKDVVIVFTYKVIVNKVTLTANNPTSSTDNSITGSQYTALSGAAFKLEKLIKGTDSNADTWQLVKEYTVDEQHPITTFEFVGLDDGNYRLTETVTPSGYNTINPIEFTISATHNDGDTPSLQSLSGNVTSGTATFSADTTSGSLSADIENKSGSTLPSTGGMGTTIFYVIGSILVIGAVVLLVSKKRMNAAE